MNDKIVFNDFVEQVASESGFDIDTAKAYVTAMFETIVEQSVAGETIKVQNFGSFIPKWYKAKRGINPQTKQAIDILPHYHIHYAMSKGLDQTLNSGEISTPIALDDSPNLFKKLVIIGLVALLIAFFYPSEQDKSIPLQTTVSETKVIAPEIVQLQTELEDEIEPETETGLTNEADLETVANSQTGINTQTGIGSGIESEPVLIPQVGKKILPEYYLVKDHETLTLISKILYEKSLYWPLLYQNNTSLIPVPDVIYPGTNLSVPEKTENYPLYTAYLLAFESYLSADKMGKSFWTLCSGAKYLGDDFKDFLKGKIDGDEYKVVRHCVGR